MLIKKYRILKSLILCFLCVFLCLKVFVAIFATKTQKHEVAQSNISFT